MRINSKIIIGKKVDINPTDEEVKMTPMLFRADKDFSMSLGNNIISSFILSLNNEFLSNDSLTIDCRVHMLMKGWYPCIPGYHHDFVPRKEDGQPDYGYSGAKHALMLINSDVSPTEFAIGESNFSNPSNHRIVYKEWHKEVIEKINAGELETLKAYEKRIHYFDDRTWHQGTKAVKRGWRLFIRASINHGVKPMNEIRNQVQVYMENPMEGW